MKTIIVIALVVAALGFCCWKAKAANDICCGNPAAPCCPLK